MKGLLKAIARIAFISSCLTMLLPIGRVNSYAETKNFSVSFSSPIWRGNEFSYSNVSVTSPNGSHINTLSVFVDNGTITYLPSASLWHTDLTQNGGHRSAIRVFDGEAANSADIASIIKQIKFKLDDGQSDLDVTIIVDGQDTAMPTVAGYTVTRGKANHYYVYVPQLLDWDKAYNAAKSLEFMGMQGYLVTITSYEEDRLLDNITTVGAWAGAVRVPKTLDDSVFNKDTVWADFEIPSDPAESVWKWVCGPESAAGKNKIKITGSYCQVSEGIEDPGEGAYYKYSNWNRNSTEPDRGNEPNNFPTGGYAGEFCMSVHYHDKGEAGTSDKPVKGWNDLYNHVENLHEDYITGYFVEFDGLDITTPMTVSITQTESYSHKWKYEVVTDDDGNKELVGECIDDSHEECEYGDEGTPVEILLSAQDKVYDALACSDAKLKIEGVADSMVSKILGDMNVSLDGSVTYEGTCDDGSSYGPSAVKPVKSGSYKAVQKLKAGAVGYSVSDSFVIEKAQLTITLDNQSVVKDKPISQNPEDAVKSVTGLCGSDVISSLVLEANVSSSGKHTIDISSSSSKPVTVKSGTDDVTSCYTITVIPAEVTVSAKTPAIDADASGSEIVYGKTLSKSVITGTVKDPDTGDVIPGKFKWKTPDILPTVADSNSTEYEVIFTPDSSDYEEIDLSIKISVVPKDINSDDISRTISLDISNAPVVELYDEETSLELVEGVDYTVSSVRDGDKEAITITGKDNYFKSFTISVPRHKWTGRVIKQILIDSSADELSPYIENRTNAQNEKSGMAMILNGLKGDNDADAVLAKQIVADIKDSGQSYDGDFNGLISLTMCNADSTVSDAEQKCAESAINPGRAGETVRIPKNAVIGMYFDISMGVEYKIVNKSVNPEKTLTDRKDVIIDTSTAALGVAGYSEKIRITVPDRLKPAKGFSRTYYIIRVHEDEFGNLDYKVMPVERSGYNLTFSTDKFSKYALAYTESRSGSGDKADGDINTDGDGSNNNPDSPATSNNTVSIVSNAGNAAAIPVAAPKTGDSNLPFAGGMMVVTGMLMLVMLLYRRKDSSV